MSIKIFIPDSEEGKHVSCYIVETQEVYLHTTEHWKHMGGDIYELQTTKEPRAYSYERWCAEGIEHSQEQKDENTLIYHRKVLIEGQIMELDTIEEFYIYLAKHSPVEVETNTYFLSDGTSLIGISDYYD